MRRISNPVHRIAPAKHFQPRVAHGHPLLPRSPPQHQPLQPANAPPATATPAAHPPPPPSAQTRAQWAPAPAYYPATTAAPQAPQHPVAQRPPGPPWSAPPRPAPCPAATAPQDARASAASRHRPPPPAAGQSRSHWRPTAWCAPVAHARAHRQSRCARHSPAHPERHSPVRC